MVQVKVLSPLLPYMFLSLFRYLIFLTCVSNKLKLINHDIYISCVVFLNFWLIKFLIYTLLGTVYISFLSSAHFHWVLYFDQCQVNLSAHLVAAYSLSLWRSQQFVMMEYSLYETLHPDDSVVWLSGRLGVWHGQLWTLIAECWHVHMCVHIRVCIHVYSPGLHINLLSRPASRSGFRWSRCG